MQYALCLGVLLAFLFIQETQGTIKEEQNNPRHAVFTTAVMNSANWKELFPFVKSLRETGYKGDIIIWTENRRILKTKLKLFKVQTEFADLKEVDGSNPLYTPAEYEARAAHGRGLNIWRFELFLQYLRKNRDRWDHVMLVDSNDVVFQRDPFEELQKKTEGESNHLRSNDLHFFAERMSYGTILTKAAREQDPQNYWKVDQSWLYACYGEEFIKRLAAEPIVCAGVIIGSTRGIEHLLTQLMAEWAKCHKKGSSDQGHINYLLFSGQLKTSFVDQQNSEAPPFGIKIWGWGNDLVVHLNVPLRHTTPSLHPPLSQDNKKELLTYNTDNTDYKSGRVVAVVHQYNRSPTLLAWAKDKWGWETQNIKDEL